MPSATPTKSFLTEGGTECEKVRVIHSNELQERKSYTYEKKRPDEGNPIKFYLLNFGNSVQPGDPVILKATISGSGHVEVQEDNADQNTYGSPGSARVVLDPPWDMEEVRLIWPCEFEVVDNTSIGYSSPGFTLRSRRQRPDYNPSLSNADIEAHPYFSDSYNNWLETRFYAWKRLYGWGTDVPDPEDYEIAEKKNQILSSLRDYFSRQWYDWEDHYVTQSQLRDGEYWTGGRDSRGRAIYLPYSFWIIPEISPKLCREDGSEIDGEGLDPITLLGYEFISDPRSDINNIDDWLEVLRINFMGTPAPLTIECDDSNCPNHCLEISRESDKAWMCICSTDDLEPTPIAENPNRIERKPPPNALDPPLETVGQRKAKGRDAIRKLQPKFDKAKAKYKEYGDLGEAAHNLHRAQDVIAKDPARPQSERDVAAAAAADALLDRDDAMLKANQAAQAMLDTKGGLDALHDFVGQNPTGDDSGISVGTAPLKPQDGWRPPLVQGGNGWNNTPSYINNNAANPDRGTTQVFGPSGGIQAAQVQDPAIVGGGGFQSPTVSGGSGFTAGQWNATPTVIAETPEEIVSQVISED